MTAINVTGVNPTANDVLIVNGPPPPRSATRPAARRGRHSNDRAVPTPSVTFANVNNLSINGQGGGDAELP